MGKVKWDVVSVGALVFAAGWATPGIPDGELLGLAVMAHGAGYI